MTLDAADDKRTIAAHEAKARDLQSKINALLTIEKVHPIYVFNKPFVDPRIRMSEVVLSN